MVAMVASCGTAGTPPIPSSPVPVKIGIREVTATGFDKEGVRLISPADPGFDATIDKLAAPGWAKLLKDSKPWLVAVSNETSQKIVALKVLYKMATIGGETTTNSSFYVAPDAIGSPSLNFHPSSERGILPRSQRLIGVGFTIPEVEPKNLTMGPGWDQARSWNWIIDSTAIFIDDTTSQYASVKKVQIELEAVIFEDGRMIGPDAAGPGGLEMARLETHFVSLVQAKQSLYRNIATFIDRGESVDAAFQAAFKIGAVRNTPETALFSASDVAWTEAASTAERLRKEYGDSKIRDILRRVLLEKPFVIRK